MAKTTVCDLDRGSDQWASKSDSRDELGKLERRPVEVQDFLIDSPRTTVWPPTPSCSVVQAPPSVLVPQCGVVSGAAGAYCGTWCAARPTATYGLRTVAAWSYCDAAFLLGGSNDLPRRLRCVHRTAPHLIKFINKENCQASAAHSNQVSSLDVDRRRLTKQLHEAVIQSNKDICANSVFAASVAVCCFTSQRTRQLA